MRTPRAALVAILTLLAAWTLAAPRALLVQISTSGETPTVRVPVDDYLAEELDELGRVQPVVWSITDPVFRAALLEGRLGAGTERPALASAQAASKALGCDYVLIFSAARDGLVLRGEVALYAGGRQTWKDARSMSSAKDTPQDAENLARSMARTWAMLLDGGPFKAHPQRPRQPTPDPLPGQLSTVDEPPARPDPTETAKLLEEVESIAKSGKVWDAVARLRDGVDVAPLDVERRRALIDLLMRAGRPDLAGMEARRAAEMIPESAELRALAARAWIEAGKKDQATSALNELVARDPNHPSARLALAEIRLLELRAEACVEHLDAAIKTSPTKTAYFLRALAYGLLGETSPMEADLAKLAEATTPGELAPEAHRTAAKALDAACDSTIDDLRSLMQRALVRRLDKEVADAASALSAQVAVRRRFVQTTSPPDPLRASHGKRLLALNLLAQSLSGLKAFLSDGNEDTLTEARIDLGEAIRQLREARKAMEA